MTTNASTFEGVLLELGQGDAESVDAATDTFDPIGELTGFDGPGGETTVIDATHSQSSAREKLIGLPDEGQFSCTVNLHVGDAGQDAARAARASRTLKNVRLTLDDYTASGTEIDFKAYVTGFSISGQADGKIEANITFEITGAATYTQGSDV